MLARAGNKVVHCLTKVASIRAIDRGGIDLTIVDVSRFQGALGVIDVALGSVPTIAITPGRDLALLNSLVCDIGVAHVMVRPDASCEQTMSDVLVTAEKLLRNDVFGLDKYIGGHDAQLRHSTLHNAEERDTCLGELTAFLHETKAPRHIIPTIANAADEMLTNAIYNAPIDESGLPRYAATNRRSKIQLDPSEHVTLHYGTEASVFGISVSDQFGRLRHSHLKNSIDRCVHRDDPIEYKEGGAGLGLFLIARTAHQFVINVAPEQQTEVIALWNLDRGRLQDRLVHHSLHYFERTGDMLPSRRRPDGTRAPTSEPEPTTDPGIN